MLLYQCTKANTTKYLYLTGEAGVRISFDTGSLNTAVEGGAGPLKLAGREPEEIEGIDPSASRGSDAGRRGRSMGHGHGSMGGSPMGGWLTDLADDGPYARTLVEREGSEKEKERKGDEKV
jgi:hypothetical protein